MKNEVKQELKEKGRGDIFTEDRYLAMVSFLRIARTGKSTLKSYLDISPDFRVTFIVDHMIKFVDLGRI